MTGSCRSGWTSGCAIELTTTSTEYWGTEYQDPVRRLPEGADASPGTQRLPSEGLRRIPGASTGTGYQLLLYSVLAAAVQLRARIPAAQLFLAGRSNPSRNEPRSVRLVSNTTLFSRSWNAGKKRRVRATTRSP